MTSEKLNKRDVLKIAIDFYKKGGLTGHGNLRNSMIANCLYYADEGGSCAWGAVLRHIGITKEMLEERGLNSCSADLVNHDEKLGKIVGDRIDESVWKDPFADMMQSAHDSADNVKGVIQNLENLAKQHHITL